MKRSTPLKRTPFTRKNDSANTTAKQPQSHGQQALPAIISVVKRRTNCRPATPAKEKRYLDRVAQLDCVVCGAHGVHIHHAREGEGMAQRAVLRQEKLDEMDLLARTIERMNP